MSTPWLSQEEVDDLCEPLTQHAAQSRYLQRLGITVGKKPNGAPLVMRAHFEQVMTPNPKKRPPGGKCEPNRTALIASFKGA